MTKMLSEKLQGLLYTIATRLREVNMIASLVK